jgi:hypothetical protein
MFVPPALAVFPQRDSIAVRSLEPELQARASRGERVFFNKGL